ncbi:MAG: hypothetical protein OXE86_09400 [Alphaproteobacteria bacterium]|nr:hypothetical protein [Alphaproteobacteria bacterium]
MPRLSRVLAAIALFAPLLASSWATAQTAEVAAQAHAAAIRAAWDRLAGFVRGQPAGTVPARLPYGWSSAGAVPAGAGWLAEWSDRGLDLRYCEGVLLVFAASADLVAVDQRTVQALGGLQWLDGGTARGMTQAGSVDIALPACMGTLPDRRVALAGRVVDPFAWDATRTRLAVDRWRLACPPPGKPAETLGYRQFRQLRPVEVHPWDGTDLARWPASCTDRRGATFTWGGQTMPLPARARCDPEGETGTEIAGAEVMEVCSRPYDPQGNNEPRWHLNDRFCAEAEAAGVSTTLDGSTWHGPPRKAYAGPTSGHPSPVTPPVPSCRMEAHCPSGYTDGGAAGQALRIRKYRYAWRGASIQEADNRNPSWHQSDCTQPNCEGGKAVRIYLEQRNPGATGDGFLYDGSENFAGCYRREVQSASCPGGETPSGSLITRVYHPDDGRGTVVISDTRVCTPTSSPPPSGSPPSSSPPSDSPPPTCRDVVRRASCPSGQTPSGKKVERVCSDGTSSTLSDTRTCTPVVKPPPTCRDVVRRASCPSGYTASGKKVERVCSNGRSTTLSDTRTCTRTPPTCRNVVHLASCPPGQTASGKKVERVCSDGRSTTLSDTRTCKRVVKPPPPRTKQCRVCLQGEEGICSRWGYRSYPRNVDCSCVSIWGGPVGDLSSGCSRGQD